MKAKHLLKKRMLAIIMLLTLSSFIDISAQSVGSTFTVNNCVRWVRGTSNGYTGMSCRVLSTEDGTVEAYWNSGDTPDGFFYATEIEIPEYVTYNNKRWRVSSICQIPLCQGSGAKLKKAILPNSLEIIGNSAFDDIGYGTKFEIVGAQIVNKIGKRAFWYCRNNSYFIDFTYVEEIGRAAFYGCDSLHVVHLPNIKKIEPTAFMFVQQGAPTATTKGLSEIVLGSDLEEIPDSCFYNQTILKDFDIPSNVNRIGKRAFWNCRSLQHVVIPEKVKTIEVATFQTCQRMSYIELPSGLTQIKDSAFYYCSNLDTIVVHSMTPPSISGSLAFFNCPRSVLYVPYGRKAAYQAANIWKNFTKIIEMEPETILATGITLNKSSLTLTSAGQTSTLVATVTPSNATNKSVTWTSSNTSVATVSSTGVVTAKANGTTNITAKTADGTNLTAQCTVTVDIKATSITLNQSALSFTAANQTATLVATVTPSTAANKNVTWTSSNTNVVTVDNNGLVTAVAAGSATITATTNDGTNLSASCEVTVSISTEKKGDTNGDNEVSVTDYLAIANHILGINVENFNASAADVNGDNDVSVVDYVGVANIILYGNYTGPAANAVKGQHIEQPSAWMEAIGTEDGNLNLLLHEMKPFAAFQMDINLPEGVEIIDAKMSKKSLTRNLGISKLEDGTWRLLYGTLENKAVALDGDNLLTLELASAGAHSGTVSFENIVLVDNHASATKLNAVYVGLPTSIRVIEGGSLINIDGYDLAGRKITNPGLKKGIYIVNGKKVFVK